MMMILLFTTRKKRAKKNTRKEKRREKRKEQTNLFEKLRKFLPTVTVVLGYTTAQLMKKQKLSRHQC